VRYVLGLVLMLFLGALAVFAFQNTQTVTVRFLNWTLTAPLAVSALAVYFLGMLSGWNVVAFVRHSISRVTTEPREYR
jgi:putative membrane protein